MNSKEQQALVGAAAVLATGLSVYYMISSSKRSGENEKAYRLIPTAGKKLPYVGHLFSLGELPGKTFAQWNKELGPLVQVKMGLQNWLILGDPKLAHEIFVTNGSVSSDRPAHTYFDHYSHFGKGIACANADKRWKKARTVALTVLAPQRVNEFVDVILMEADNLVNQLLTETELKGQIDPGSILHASALNVILNTCFGKRVNSVDDPLFDEIMHFVDTSMKYGEAEGDLSQYMPIFKYLDIIAGKNRVFSNFINNYRDPLFKRLITEAAASDKDSLIKSFLALKDENGLDDKDIIVIMSDLVGAGADTTAISLSWMFVILSHYPQIQKDLHAEVDAFVNTHGRLPTFEERDQLPLLTSVQKESFRFMPTSPFGIPHVTKDDLVVRDYFIPKGTVLVPNMLAMHRNPEVYPEPDVFKPDRFLNNNRTMSSSANGGINNRDHYNFGWGRRICPGIHLAEVEMFHVCTRIFANCIVEPPLDKNGQEMPIDMDSAVNAGIVWVPSPYQVRFTRRDKAPIHRI